MKCGSKSPPTHMNRPAAARAVPSTSRSSQSAIHITYQSTAAAMVYTEMNQLKRYHHRPEPFLATSQHFYDKPSAVEGAGKSSTHGKLYHGSLYFSAKAGQPKHRSWTDGNLHSTGDLDRAPPPRQQLASSSTSRLSSTYRGNGTFTVELPHTTIHYKNPGMVPYSQLTWRSEYTDKYVGKKAYPGYSTLSSRWTRPQTTRW